MVILCLSYKKYRQNQLSNYWYGCNYKSDNILVGRCTDVAMYIMCVKVRVVPGGT